MMTDRSDVTSKRSAKLATALALLLAIFTGTVPAQTTPRPPQPSTPSAQPPPRPPQPSLPFAPTTTRSIEELRAAIAQVVNQPELAPAQIAAKVVSLDTGRTIFELNADKLMQPASNMKLYTIAAALDRLGPDFRFVTSVYAPMRPDAQGRISGDLVIYGRGDPSFAARFYNGDYYRAIDELADKIVAAGVRRVAGDLVGDESYFTGMPFGSGWEVDDLQWYYGAEISALTVNDNALDLSIKPGARIGDAGTITTGPATSLLTIVNRTTTGPKGTRRELAIYRPLGENVLDVEGTIPADDPGFSASVSISHPAMLFVSMLRAALEKRGVEIRGKTRVVDARSPRLMPAVSLVEITNRPSPPLSVVAAQVLKPSQNLYAELVLRALGNATRTDPRQQSEEAGIEAVKQFLRAAGIDETSVQIVDGSGLSRGNLVTAEATTRLLIYMFRHRHAQVFRDALPIAGVDGTLRNRMRGTAAAGNVRAKTGTINNAASLSGYVTTAAGERLVFSLIVNNLPREAEARRIYLDAVAVLLAMFAGRS
ncbi:MAG: D-alanyl-D-alanine carboxypeptidase/D-alanyl-D-alanine-endopeptidase [Pyrinomonas sp.]|uniref:D-alanyl-D-alanine carboxypeptidase/D-alanyl-D-alanine endopeptidase n=1 Tax=Pyrinomonas sp. TaxID=2080306 RepID=UPI003333808D